MIYLFIVGLFLLGYYTIGITWTVAIALPIFILLSVYADKRDANHARYLRIKEFGFDPLDSEGK